jgi:hypothetical protein
MKKMIVCFIIAMFLVSPVFAEKADLGEPYTPTRYEWLSSVLDNHADGFSRSPKFKGARVSHSVDWRFGRVLSFLYVPKDLTEKEVDVIKRFCEVGIYSVIGGYDWAADLKVEIKVTKE